MLKCRMMQIADRITLLVDAGKFGVKALKKFAQLSDIHQIITNNTLDPVLIDELKARDVSLILAR